MIFNKEFEANHQRLFATLFMLGACFSFPAGSVAFKFIFKYQTLSIFQLSAYRQIIVFTVNGLLMKKTDDPYDKKISKLLYLQSLFGALIPFFYFSACRYGPVWKAEMFMQTTPLWVNIISIFILKTQQYSRTIFVIITLSLVGIMLLIRPPFIRQIESLIFSENEVVTIDDVNNYDEFKSTIFALFLMCIYTCSTLLAGQLKGKTTSRVLVQIPGVIGTSLYSIFGIIEADPDFYPTLFSYFGILMMGLLSLLGQSLITKAWLIGPITYVSVLQYFQVLIAFCYDYIFFGVKVETTNIIGAILIIISVVTLIRQKQ